MPLSAGLKGSPVPWALSRQAASCLLGLTRKALSSPEAEKGKQKRKKKKKKDGEGARNAPYRALIVRHMVQYAVSHQQHAVCGQCQQTDSTQVLIQVLKVVNSGKPDLRLIHQHWRVFLQPHTPGCHTLPASPPDLLTAG